MYEKFFLLNYIQGEVKRSDYYCMSDRMRQALAVYPILQPGHSINSYVNFSLAHMQKNCGEGGGCEL